MFDDDDSEVQANLGIAIHRLDEIPASEMEGLIDALTESSAFPQHMDSLMYALEQLPAEMPANAITACERVVKITGADLADPSKASALTGLHMVTVVLRLYRQGDQDTRVRCLNIIDRLAEFNLYDLEPTTRRREIEMRTPAPSARGFRPNRGPHAPQSQGASDAT